MWPNYALVSTPDCLIGVVCDSLGAGGNTPIEINQIGCLQACGLTLIELDGHFAIHQPDRLLWAGSPDWSSSISLRCSSAARGKTPFTSMMIFPLSQPRLDYPRQSKNGGVVQAVKFDCWILLDGMICFRYIMYLDRCVISHSPIITSMCLFFATLWL